MTARRRLAGDPDPRQLPERILRVDHAGEYGAKRIYDGQPAVLGKSAAASTIRHMAPHEHAPLDDYVGLRPHHRARPPLRSTVWQNDRESGRARGCKYVKNAVATGE